MPYSAMITLMPRLSKARASSSRIPSSVTKELMTSSVPRRVKEERLILVEFGDKVHMRGGLDHRLLELEISRSWDKSGRNQRDARGSKEKLARKNILEVARSSVAAK